MKLMILCGVNLNKRFQHSLMSNPELIKLFRDVERIRLTECVKIIKENPDIDIDKLVDDLIPPMKVVIIDDRKRSTTRRETPSSISEGERCSQTLKSGKNAGRLCSKRRFGTASFCKIHLKNKEETSMVFTTNEISIVPPQLTQFEEDTFVDKHNYIYNVDNKNYICKGKLNEKGVVIDLTKEDKKKLDKECILYY